MARSYIRQQRHSSLSTLLENNPLYTDEELAVLLNVSISTIRLDRALLGIPELRERMRQMAEKATSRLRSIRCDEVVGELLELELNVGALSVMHAAKEMAFRHTGIVWDYHIYSQASSLAIAVIGADLVVTGSGRVRYKRPAYVGDKLIARAKVGVHKGNKYVVSVRTKVEDAEIFVGRYIVVASDEKPTGGFENP